MVNHSSALSNRPETTFGPAFRLKVSIDKPRRRSPLCRALQLAKPPRCRGCDELPPSFDHLVGEGEQRGRHLKAERFGGLQVEDQLELGRLLDW
jgi:hypothetical protein